MDIATKSVDLGSFFDAEWYRAYYPDVAAAGVDPLSHFLNHGIGEGRNPNRFFDSAWYLQQYPDVLSAGIHPLQHYMMFGAQELRNPHPRFDAVFYADEHPEATANPLLHHVLVGQGQGWATENIVPIAHYLPSGAPPPPAPPGVAVDIVIPVYRGLAETQRCLASVLADPERPPGDIIVIDDHAPEPALSAWLDEVNGTGAIRLIRNRRNLGFVRSVNRGMQVSRADVVLLNSDTEVPHGWLARLAGHAYAQPRTGSVSPFSNNATICSYPREEGGRLPFGRTLAEIDAACREANGGRSVEVPTTVGYCMYIRRACLDEIGPFDAETFGRGYGEENDFCRRSAARGWRHLLACDTFVYHEGHVSFGADSADLDGKADALLARHPDFNELVSQHVRRDKVGPYRFALTAALFRRWQRPTLLQVTHGLGGGVRQQMDMLAERVGERAGLIELTARSNGIALGVPSHPSHPEMVLGDDRQDDLVLFLRSAGVSRIHIHHTLGNRLDLRRLTHQLGVPFDFTVHDFLTICPQINMLPQRDSQYCGAPGPAVCNACIAARPEVTVADIHGWRARHGWLLREAERVLCPSEDTRAKLATYGLAGRALVAPHEPAGGGGWGVRRPAPPRGRKLRVAMLGVLTSHKGARAVAAVAEEADPADLEITLIGYSEVDLPPAAAARVRETGAYERGDLPRLIGRLRPHVIWFPGQVPETYSFTLSAALKTGLPIVASDVGAFPERLANRPLTWIVDPAAPAADWIAAFEAVRAAIADRAEPLPETRRPAAADFYAGAYLRPPARPARGAGAPVDLRQPGRTTVLLVPERHGGTTITPCGYIRLLLPLDHLAARGGLDVVVATAEEALHCRADVLACQRHSVAEAGEADGLVEHCRRHEMRLVYDLDDDLPNIPDEHPDAATLQPRAAAVGRLLRGADAVWVSTADLRSALAPVRPDAVLLPNGLDERLWCAAPPPLPPPFGTLRVLYMGTATHDADFALVRPALERLHATYGERVRLSVLGVTAGALPHWAERVELPDTAATTYPGFVHWITRQGAWDVGIAPLADTPFNRCKSAIKTMDYAGLGLAILASDVAAYRGSIADGVGGRLVAADAAAWFAALASLADDWRKLHRFRTAATAALAGHTLAALEERRAKAWSALISAAKRQAAA